MIGEEKTRVNMKQRWEREKKEWNLVLNYLDELQSLQIWIQINQNNPILCTLFSPNQVLMANPKLNLSLKSPKSPKSKSF